MSNMFISVGLEGSTPIVAPVENATALIIEHTVTWDNGETWHAPYTQDELTNISEGIMFADDADTEIRLKSGVKRGPLRSLLVAG